VALLLDVREQALLAVPRGGKSGLPRQERGARGALLLGLLGENCGGLRDVRLRRRCLLFREAQLALQPLDRVGDVLVLLPDRVEVVELLEEVAEALCLQEDLELRRLVALVELD
jgi:hypothetical protein